MPAVMREKHTSNLKNHVNKISKHVNVFKNHVSKFQNHDNAKTAKITEVEKISKNHDNNIVNHDGSLIHHDINIINHTQKTNEHVNVFLKHTNKKNNHVSINKKHVNKFSNHTHKFPNHVNTNKNYTNVFKNLIPYIPMVGMLAISAIVTMNLRTLPSSADSDSEASVVVFPSCSFLGTVDEAHTANIINGQYKEDIGTTTLRTYCNDANGYEIYAVGFSNDTLGNTNLIEQEDNALTIATGLYPGADKLKNSTPSSWSMKLTPITGTYTPTIESDADGNSFEDYHIIPEEFTKVASYPAGMYGKYKTDSSLTTTYDTYVNQTQPTGTYTGKVKYTMVQTAANIRPYYIQDMTLNDCKVNVGENGNGDNIGDNITVYDERGGNDYTVRYINGYCWMTQNLRFTGTSLSPDTSNVASDTNMTYYSLDSSDASYSGHCDPTNGYNYACIKESESATYGVWYNYAAATANSILGSNNTTASVQDICPKNWHLPSGPNTTVGTDINILVGNTLGGWRESTVGTTALGGTTGGRWWNGVLSANTLAAYWASISKSSVMRWLLYHRDTEQIVGSGDDGYRHVGYFVRCVRTK